MTAFKEALYRATARGVVGEFDHSIEFQQSEDFIIVFGPNGVGKTNFLEIIHRISSLQAFELLKIPFSEATLDYADGSSLSAKRILGSVDSDIYSDSYEENNSTNRAHSIQFTLVDVKGERFNWIYTLERDSGVFGSNFEQISEDYWIDLSDGEVIHRNILRRRFGGQIRAPKSTEIADEKAVFNEFVESRKSFLIETQRLVRNFSGVITSSRVGGRSRHAVATPRILDQAKIVSDLLVSAQTEHSRRAQRLDRAFPSKVLNADAHGLQSEEEIRSKYDQQNALRERVGKIASVEFGGEIALPDEALDTAAMKLLSQYVQDTEEKLEPFEELLEKIELLEEMLNDRFLRKRIEITDKGISVRSKKNMEELPLNSLSSGEQHEIVLLTDLLFQVPSGSIVLIDEPEISLQVAWQLAFIRDVKRIADIVGFKFIVATHSPQIINDEWANTIHLGPTENEENDFDS